MSTIILPAVVTSDNQRSIKTLVLSELSARETEKSAHPRSRACRCILANVAHRQVC